MKMRFLVVLAISCCGCTTYRYSAKVLACPAQPFPRGSFSITELDVGDKQGYPWKLIREEALLLALGESQNAHRESTPIKLVMRSSFRKFPSSLIGLNFISFGLIPASTRTTADIDVFVSENGKMDESRNFRFQLEECARFTPLGLWPFIGENYEGELYATVSSPGHELTTPVFNKLFGSIILSGLTMQGKKMPTLEQIPKRSLPQMKKDETGKRSLDNLKDLPF